MAVMAIRDLEPYLQEHQLLVAPKSAADSASTPTRARVQPA